MQRKRLVVVVVVVDDAIHAVAGNRRGFFWWVLELDLFTFSQGLANGHWSPSELRLGVHCPTTRKNKSKTKNPKERRWRDGNLQSPWYLC